MARKERSTLKRLPFALLILLGIPRPLAAQASSDVHQRTTAPSNARFEIVQSELAAKWTFQLDRFTGQVWQLVKTKEDDDAWHNLKVIGLPQIAAPARARFQIFASGIAAKFTFLLDTETGKTWVLTTRTYKDSDGADQEEHVWQQFVE
jgi:hypothetical protein